VAMNIQKTETVVIFDLDKTITIIDTYIQYLVGVLFLRPGRIFIILHLPILAILNIFGLVTDQDLKLRFLKSIAGGIQRDRLQRWTKIFVRFQMLFNTRRKAIEKLDYHKSQGDILVLASASFDFYVRPIAHFLKFDYVISTKSCWTKDGKLIPEINGNNLKGEYKLNEIKRILGDKIHKTNSIVYTDHISDLPLLEFANEAYVVNPNRQMKTTAAYKNFIILKW
jgi:phosphatidylglycerophosphatase C